MFTQNSTLDFICDGKDEDKDNGYENVKRDNLNVQYKVRWPKQKPAKQENLSGEPWYQVNPLVFCNWSWPLYQVLFICIRISFVSASIIGLNLCICFGLKG